MLKEFREFAMKGNVLDLAIGVIIGGAFGGVVGSLVNDIMMPPFGMMLGGIDFSHFALTLKAAEGDRPAVLLSYGKFLNAVINFIIVAFAIFLLVKQVNRFRKQEAAAPPPPPAPSAEEKLLGEIRDILKASR